MSEALMSEGEDKANYVTREEFERLQKQLEDLKGHCLQEDRGKEEADGLSILVFSGSLDKAISSLIIATGAKASGFDVTMFFSFWGTSILKKNGTSKAHKSFMEKMFGYLLPKDSTGLPLSQKNMLGLGPRALRYMMKQKNATSLEELIAVAQELEVKFSICEMTMDLMGIDPQEIIDYPYLNYGGVTNFLETANRGNVTLFI